MMLPIMDPIRRKSTRTARNHYKAMPPKHAAKEKGGDGQTSSSGCCCCCSSIADPPEETGSPRIGGAEAGLRERRRWLGNSQGSLHFGIEAETEKRREYVSIRTGLREDDLRSK
ncbi:hypothetical protein OsI_17897 [Oryza sativa Indica Group]|uniref:Uncharacterized protein n=1 Tax=Oryza sativa subsp. indica TaxID=39946 RepID=B8ARF3_ORYSI|nr:hypothetical protein OsI_17897 [Oryza sativa Indica Group]